MLEQPATRGGRVQYSVAEPATVLSLVGEGDGPATRSTTPTPHTLDGARAPRVEVRRVGGPGDGRVLRAHCWVAACDGTKCSIRVNAYSGVGDPTRNPSESGESMKRLIASLALGGSLLGGIAVPLTLTAQSAYAAPNNSHAKNDPDPNLPVMAQQALIRNGSWEHVAAQSCRIFLTSAGPILICT
jgi:hypothetical protein